MTRARILFLEDEPQLGKIVTETLHSRGFIVSHVSNGRQGIELTVGNNFDLCIVDVMMPFMDGFTFATEFRKTDQHTPILFLTARGQDKDVIEGYRMGGNDYLRKPFSLEELILRIKELLRRNHFNVDPSPEILRIGAFEFNLQRQELRHIDSPTIKLSHRENELLMLLALHRNGLLEKRATLIKLWGDDSPHNARTMDVFITKLRKHFSNDPSVEIINSRGLGYKMLF
jgi:DNA-binding response OmpR family regulator